MTTPNTNATPADTAIHTRGILVWLHIGTWSARKYDKQASAELNKRHGATSDASRVNKLLIPGENESYKTLTNLANAIRAEHYNNTLAWSDEGWRILPTANYTTYTDWLRARMHEFAAARIIFGREYPAMCDAAPRLLNGLWKAADYPSPIDVMKRFHVSVEYAPIPINGDIRVNLAADQVAALEQEISERSKAATENAMRDAWERLHDVVSKMAERISDPTAIFRDTLVSNVANVCDVLKRLNITDDPNLEAMRARVARELSRVSPDTLRDSKPTRAETAEKAAAILKTMEGFF